jgi:cytochrome c biogenesis protein CcdA
MNTLLNSLVAIAAVDSINPNTMAVQIYLLSFPKPISRTISFITGYFLASWLSGWLLTLGFTHLVAQIANNLGEALYFLQILLGLVFALFGYYYNQFTSQSSPVDRPRSISPRQTFWLGFAITVVEIPTALPYFAAIERIVSARLESLEIAYALTLYNLVFILPLAVLLGIYFFLYQNATSALKTIHRAMNKWSPIVMRVLLLILGFLTIFDAVARLLGHSLF